MSTTTIKITIHADTQCSDEQMIAKIREVKELERIADEAKKEADKLKEEIKAEMHRRRTDEMIVGDFIVRHKYVESNRFDSACFKKKYPELYEMYVKCSGSYRFTIGC